MSLTVLLYASFLHVAEAKPAASTDKIPAELRNLLRNGGWTPSPTNSARYQVGDVFDFSSNKEITKGKNCFASLPDTEPMTDIEISRYLKGGFKIPLGLLKGKSKGTRYKRLTYANTEVQEFSQMEIDQDLKRKCRDYLAKELRRAKNHTSFKLIKAVIQSTVNEQVCTSVKNSVGARSLGVSASAGDKCEFDTSAPVTIAYQLVTVNSILRLKGLPKVTTPEPEKEVAQAPPPKPKAKPKKKPVAKKRKKKKTKKRRAKKNPKLVYGIVTGTTVALSSFLLYRGHLYEQQISEGLQNQTLQLSDAESSASQGNLMYGLGYSGLLISAGLGWKTMSTPTNVGVGFRGRW